MLKSRNLRVEFVWIQSFILRNLLFMEKQNLYSENSSAFAIAGMFFFLALTNAFNFYSAGRINPVGFRPSISYLYALFSILLVLFAGCYCFIRIRLTNAGIQVSYGPIKKTLAWKNVTACRIPTPAGKELWINKNVLGSVRVTYTTRCGRSREMPINTRKPEELVRVANELMRLNRR